MDEVTDCIGLADLVGRICSFPFCCGIAGVNNGIRSPVFLSLVAYIGLILRGVLRLTRRTERFVCIWSYKSSRVFLSTCSNVSDLSVIKHITPHV